MGFQNRKYEDENAAYYRFTAYLKISITRRKGRYMAKYLERQKQEISYDEHIELLNCIHGEDVYLSSELEDELLCRALTRLREQERTIVFRRAVSRGVLYQDSCRYGAQIRYSQGHLQTVS